MFNALEKPYVLIIAGLDPTAGAGILADVKTCMATGSYAFAVATCLTSQTEDTCLNIQWTSFKEITEQLKPLLENYTIGVAKIGAIKDAALASEIIDYVHKFQPEIKIIWDPILIASSGQEFMKMNMDIKDILNKVYLLTPNFPEVKMLTNDMNELEGSLILAMHTSIYLKGGHSHEEILMDRLYENTIITEFRKDRNEVSKKHGSGCVVSTAIASYVAQGYSLKEACGRASEYMCDFFASSTTKLGVH